ncbi:MAG: hypothetical protein ABW252_19425 [Polyangiales bacterium]
MLDRAVLRAGLAVLALASGALPRAQAQAQAPTRRVDLRVLVLADGPYDQATQMVRAGLDEAMVPHTDVDLSDDGRADLSEAFLVDTREDGVRHARFQGVVLSSALPAGLRDAEREALSHYEREFGVRQLDAYAPPGPSLGLSEPLHSGTLDGATARVTEAGARTAFSYLAGEVPFEDLLPDVHETYGYLAAPLAPEDGRAFTPLLEAVLPDGAARGVILGVYDDDGREEMAVLVAMNASQLAQQMLFPGMLSWLTRGVHLGQERAYLSVHVDDLFQDNGRWSETAHCTLTDDCEPSSRVPRIVMTPADVDALVAWQERMGFRLHLAFNGGIYVENQSDARHNPRIAQLGERLIARRADLTWINHTYTHEYLGCVENDDFTCQLRDGQVQWVSHQVARTQIERNIAFAAQVGIPIDPTELVTGQHSGLRRPDREPSDNPNLLRALADLDIRWVGADDSIEREQRQLAGTRALTVPRYPMNVYYNCGTKRENAQEYSWVYAASRDGGSGRCEASESCQAPLDPERGYDDVIVPQEVRTTLMHVLSNDPRPHYAHQSNLAEERILYPVVEGALSAYRRAFRATQPIVAASMTEVGTELARRAAYRSAQDDIEAYVEAGKLVLRVRDGADARDVPVTVAAHGSGLPVYGALESGWRRVTAERPSEIALDAVVGYAR